MNNIEIDDESTCFSRCLLFPSLAISADPEAMMEYAKATKKQRRREETMQDRENMSKFLNSKYNKRRLK